MLTKKFKCFSLVTKTSENLLESDGIFRQTSHTDTDITVSSVIDNIV